MPQLHKSAVLLATRPCFAVSNAPLLLHSNSPDHNSIPTQIPGQNALLMGTDWYPEQWPESRWEVDLSMMDAAHLNMIRIAEFSWSRMVPFDGHFDFAWLDRSIVLAAKHHIAVVLGTPMAAPPAWLTHEYPDTLGMDTDGQRVRQD